MQELACIQTDQNNRFSLPIHINQGKIVRRKSQELVDVVLPLLIIKLVLVLVQVHRIGADAMAMELSGTSPSQHLNVYSNRQFHVVALDFLGFLDFLVTNTVQEQKQGDSKLKIYGSTDKSQSEGNNCS